MFQLAVVAWDGNVVGSLENQLATFKHLEVPRDKEIFGITGHASSYLDARLPVTTPNLNGPRCLHNGRQWIAINEGKTDRVEVAILDAIWQTFCACQCARHHHRVRIGDDIVRDFPARLPLGQPLKLQRCSSLWFIERRQLDVGRH